MAVAVSAQTGAGTYSPPFLVTADLPGPVPPHLYAGGDVFIEATVDQRGALTRPVVLRTTPPFGNLIMDVIGRWTFKPAVDVRPDNSKGPVDSTILIAAIYRAPYLVNTPGVTEPPRELARPTAAVAVPLSIVTPPYPITAVNGSNASVVLYEVSIDEQGVIRSTRAVAGDPGFDSASREALLQWKFRPTTYRGRPAPAVAYVLFGFPVPVLGPSGDPPPPDRPTTAPPPAAPPPTAAPPTAPAPPTPVVPSSR
jgi:hypothetical protein